jgi:hypothetical protein
MNYEPFIMTFEEKVKYIISSCRNTDDCYYLIKALYDDDTKQAIFTPTFLDTKSAVRLRDELFNNVKLKATD